MLKSLIRYHLIPILFALFAAISVVYIVMEGFYVEPEYELLTVEGTQEKIRGKYSNLLEGEQAEIDLLGSLKKSNQITIFGSSELSLSDYASYHFLPDSIGIPALGFGHAYHQNLSILIELLAAKDYLKESKVCILLSPGWFNTNGTNVEAFIEFAQPNLINKIWNDTSISYKYKMHIGRYIHQNYSHINGVSPNMDRLKNMYVKDKDLGIYHKSRNFLIQNLIGERKQTNTTYEVEVIANSVNRTWNGDFEESKRILQKEFVSKITNNEIYVYDDYFSKYLAKEDGTFNLRPIQIVELDGREEYNDFLLVLQFLKEMQVNASFVIQPFNPYFYSGTEDYAKVMNRVERDIAGYGFPSLNMYVPKKEDYQPATLKDVMHLGDYGWMTINEFLMETYHE